MTDEQLKLFDRYQYIVPNKIAELAPKNLEDEDLHQEVYVDLVNFLCGETFSRRVGTSWEKWAIFNCVERSITRYLKNREKETKVNIARVYYKEDPVFDIVARLCLKDTLEEAMCYSLTKSERDVLSLLFGIRNETAHTMDEVCEILGVSVEKAKHLEISGSHKLRGYPARKRFSLREYW